jgi:hypothetical protein
MEYKMDNWDLENPGPDIEPIFNYEIEDVPSMGSSKVIKQAATEQDLASLILNTLRSTIASLNEVDPNSITQFVQRLGASDKVLKRLPKGFYSKYVGIFEILLHEASVSSDNPVSLFHLPVSVEYSAGVKSELGEIRDRVGMLSNNYDPHAEWADLVEIVQRHYTRAKAAELVTALDARSNLTDLMVKFKAIEPPTTKKSVSRAGGVKTAKELITDINAAKVGSQDMRFSSGLPTLDLGYTGQNEVNGFIAPGQFIVVMGPTGTGKSSFANSVTPSFAVDLQNWGLKDALQLVWHTEEESIDKLKGFRFGHEADGTPQEFNYLSDNLVIDGIGTSRTRMAQTLYDLVIVADEKSRKFHRPITDFLPYICQLDYIQSVQESGEDEKTATSRTAEFLLRGVCAWNPEEMAKFSGVDFSTYASMAWPKGMEQHRVAVVAYAQLVKIDDESLLFKKNKRNVQLSDFALLDDKDEPYWDVHEGDLRLFGKNQMRGSGIIAQNAHAIVILHRSVPYNNPSKPNGRGGKSLTDTRARILFDKSRTGSQLAYAPMRFDVQSNGYRAQYFDELAERAILAGKLKNIDKCYTKPGDPILPVRPKLNSLEAFKY